MQKNKGILSGYDSDPSPFHMDDGTVIFIFRTPMKGVYSRYKSHALVMAEPGKLDLHATMTAKFFTLMLVVSGISLIIFTLAAGLFVSFIFGGILLLGIGIFSTNTWIESVHFILDERSGLLSCMGRNKVTPELPDLPRRNLPGILTSKTVVKG